ncbi:amidohydrolase [Propionibacterium cyclohexanicum]|uniref:Amidohydrolase n=1 Tax=Propionibacterium cyclohexanicum TaxID=64702 RepID=A0A1H9SWR3_9ACTN|nr:amidohydrolase [Propionibacterium cyclohexanicum]SER89264.1 amidohydrolase [Propionibacterium cyclohexanicum]
MSIDQMAIHEQIEQIAPQIVADRRHLHAHPELSLEEYQTAAFIAARLDELSIAHRSIGRTGVLGTLPGRAKGPRIMLRADIDALPLRDGCGAPWANTASEVNHACGHDGHIAALLGAAAVLVQHRDDFDGVIEFAFQPAEEIGAGAILFERAKELEGLDQVFGLHLVSGLPAGTVDSTAGAQWASVDKFTIDVTGRGGHVAQPQLSQDALVTAASIVVELQQVVARELDPFQPAVVGIGVLRCGENYNIIASSAHIEGTVRAFDEAVRAQLLAALERIARGVGEAHRTRVVFSTRPYTDALSNDPGAAALAAQVAARVPGVDHVVTDGVANATGDDFAVFLHHAPGVYLRVGSGGTPSTSVPHHSYGFALNEAALPIAAELHVSYALSWFGTR